MAVDDTSVVDFVSVDTEGNAVLTISDHLPWDEKNEHLLTLQEKLNRYLLFIESGEMADRFPETRGKTPVVSVIALYHPNDTASAFLRRVDEALRDVGIGFRFAQRHYNSP